MSANELQSLFIKESSSLIKECQDSILCLQISDNPKKEVGRILRNLHTLKGNASLANFWDLTSTIHELEEIVINFDWDEEGFLIENTKLNFEFEKLHQMFLSLKDNVTHQEENEINPDEKVKLLSFSKKCSEMVQVLASQLDKNVSFEFDGKELEIPKALIQIISDPIQHILKNAVDHGVAHKGKVTVSAIVGKNRFILKIKDNGKGIQPKVVFKKAHQKGLIPPTAKITDYTEDQIFYFLFLPGFSTCDHISHVSGRGIGLDAAKKKINDHKGDIEIKSSSQGTTFSIIIPIPSPSKNSAA